MKKIAICFGGVSPEHEVSIITGLQVIEHIDTTQYQSYPLYVSKTGQFYYLLNVGSRTDFLNASKVLVSFGKDLKGGFMQTSGFLSKKIYLDAAFLAFHGGNGESGQLEGLFESISVPHTGHSVLTSAISMNKQVTKEIVSLHNVKTIEGLSFQSNVIALNAAKVAHMVCQKLKLPVIVKPAHLGSSIGITVCESEIAVTKALLLSSKIDTEILVEKLMKGFVEYNCAVRTIDGKIEVSEIEKPNMQDEILSFKDKYERGGGKKTGGMASLTRELPAKVTSSLKKEIQEKATLVYESLRATGMLRCDFMFINKTLYLTEVNPIPGSMSFYLWEASGINFTDQITAALQEAINLATVENDQQLDYKTEIVSSFVNSTSR